MKIHRQLDSNDKVSSLIRGILKIFRRLVFTMTSIQGNSLDRVKIA